jgi:hypothetical protein
MAAICGGKKTKMLMSCCSSPKVMNRRTSLKIQSRKCGKCYNGERSGSHHDEFQFMKPQGDEG